MTCKHLECLAKEQEYTILNRKTIDSKIIVHVFDNITEHYARLHISITKDSIHIDKYVQLELLPILPGVANEIQSR